MNNKPCRLKDIAKITMGQSPKGTSYNNQRQGVPFLQGNKTFGSLYPVIDTWTTEPTKIAKKDSVLMSVRAPVGDLNIANDNICIGRGLCSIEMNNGNNKYLLFLLKNSINKIKQKSSGTVFDSINKNELEEILIVDFDEDTQNKISEMLTNIDNKIQINNQINDNLLEILKLKFNNWINNLGEYTISNLSSIANYKNGLAMQKYRPINEEGLPVIKIKEMNSGLSNETERCSSNIDKDVIINDGDVLFAWSGTLCMTIWCNGKAGLNQHIFKVTSDKYPKWFYYFWTMKHLDKFIQIAAGKATTMGHIKRNELDSSEVLLPNDSEITKMDNFMNPLLEKYIENLKENRKLEKLRDTLLPKLMNGEIDLDKVEI